METAGLKTSIDEFKAWVARSDWPHLIEKVQELYRRPFYIQSLWAKGIQEDKLAVDTALMGRKEEWTAALEERNTPELEPNWKDIRKEIESDKSMKNRDIVRENSPIITSLGLLYCAFADACRTGHNSRIEQYIGCFAVIFQATKSTKYAPRDDAYGRVFQETIEGRNEGGVASILSYQYIWLTKQVRPKMIGLERPLLC